MDLSPTSPSSLSTSTTLANNIATNIAPDSTITSTPQQQQQSQSQDHSQQQQQPSQSGYSSPNRPPKKSSSTCTTCRARKVRCNGARPVCSNCHRLGFPCSYDDDSADPAALAAAWSVALPRRRVKQACLSCHSRKARCSGHMPACDRCQAQGIDCIYRPTKRARTSTKSLSGGRNSPHSHDDESHRDDGQGDSDSGFPDPMGNGSSNAFGQDVYDNPTVSLKRKADSPRPLPDESLDALIGQTFEKFFRHVHHIPMFSFLHRASLMEQYHASKVERSLLLALVGITSCLTDMGPGMRAYGNRCIDEAESIILSDYARPSTIKVQALVFIIKHRILANRFSNAFVLLGVASRFATALRLNYDAPNICFLAQESRRRLMWALYCIDAGISGGNRDYSLWRADRIFLGLPCNERNFEFDLPQETEKLIPDTNPSPSAQAEDIGSLALHIRIQHIRHKISEFTKDALTNRDMRPSELQTRVLSLHGELEDFAAHLPVSFQFSENSLRLRAYSPRICVFVMIHVWWRQCHCDLYRLGLIGLREALSRTVLEKFDDSFIQHCQRQCVDHAMAMANMFSSMHKLNAKLVADIDLAVCAYQCTRMLKYAYHANSGKLNLSAETIMEQFKVCLQTVKECCTGIAAAGIKADIEKIIAQGLGPRTSPSRTTTPPGTSSNRNSSGFPSGIPRHAIFREMEGPGDSSSIQPNSDRTSSGRYQSPKALPTPAAPTPIDSQMTSAVIPDTWDPSLEAEDSTMTLDTSQQDFPDPDTVPSELNNAFEGAMDAAGLGNGLDYSMGINPNIWAPGNGDWNANEFTTTEASNVSA